jgi:hypothetical protein
MKKGLTIIFLLVYSFSVLGFALKEMYCCGRLKAVVVALTIDEKTNCNKAHEHNGCCKTKYHYLKIADSYLTSTATPVSVKPVIELYPIAALCQPHFYYYKTKPVVSGSHAPPLHNGIPIHIYNCVYRI